jgi:hypothetical protein
MLFVVWNYDLIKILFTINLTAFSVLQTIFFLVGQSPHYRGFTIKLRHTTLGGIPLDESSARRIDLYLTVLNTPKRQTSMSPSGFEPTIPTSERPQTHVLERAATSSDYTVWNDSATSDYSQRCSRKGSRFSFRDYIGIYIEGRRKKSTHLSQRSLPQAEVEHETSRTRNGDAIG